MPFRDGVFDGAKFLFISLDVRCSMKLWVLNFISQSEKKKRNGMSQYAYILTLWEENRKDGNR